MKSSAQKLIIDESVSAKDEIRFERYLKKRNIKIAERLSIHEKHPGMPDFQILRHFIDPSSILITSDRPFHNKVLSKGFQSFYIDEKEITCKFLKGIAIKPDIPVTKKNSDIRNNYYPPKAEIHHFILPTSPAQLKKLTTKRRRIRNHFGGQENIEEIAVTVSLKPINCKTLIGIRVQVSSHVGLKAITGSENYILENIEGKYAEIVSLCYALIMVIRLMLHSVKTVIYYDSSKIELDREKKRSLDYHPLFLELEKCFFNLEFHRVSKGRHIERLRKKLEDLSHHQSNEMIQGDIVEIIQRMSEASDSHVKGSVRHVMRQSKKPFDEL